MSDDDVQIKLAKLRYGVVTAEDKAEQRRAAEEARAARAKAKAEREAQLAQHREERAKAKAEAAQRRATTSRSSSKGVWHGNQAGRTEGLQEAAAGATQASRAVDEGVDAVPRQHASPSAGVNALDEPPAQPAAPGRKPRAPRRVSKSPETLDEKPVLRVAKPELQAALQEALDMPYEAPSFHFNTGESPEAELAARELARRRLLPFIQRFRPKYMAGWVHADICRRIERFVEQVEQGKSPRLLLMMPPRSGKSEISSRHTPAWILGKHPEWEIIAGSHTSSLALSFSRYLRDLMRNPAYQVVFPESRLDPNSQALENWNTTKGGGYLAAGVGTGITGRGAHVLLLDDLVKDMEAADSETIREGTWEWYLSTAYTRLAPGGGVLGLMTWWHEDDWAGRIQEAMRGGEGDQFEVIRYPAINDQGDEYILADDAIVQIAPGMPVPQHARMTRPMNTAVHPARYTTEAMLKIKRNLIGGGMKRVWDALYQQNPLPDEGIEFTKQMFRYYGTRPDVRDLRIYQAWDFAISEGKESDYTVGACIGVDHRDNVYVLDLKRFKSGDGAFIIDEVLDFAQEWGVHDIGVEDGQIWKSLKFQFEKRCSEKRFYPSFEQLVPLTDKKVRASPLKGRMQLGKVYFDKLAHYFTDMQKELLTFPNGKHDDIVDALAWAIRLTLARAAPRRRDTQPKTKSWKDKLSALIGGGGGSHMAS